MLIGDQGSQTYRGDDLGGCAELEDPARGAILVVGFEANDHGLAVLGWERLKLGKWWIAL